MTLRSRLLCLALLAGLAGSTRAGDPPAPTPAPAPATRAQAQGKPVDLVLCLDASGSMSGLIDAARKKLWDVVTLLAQARPTPRLRVALYRYGMSGLDAERHVERLVPLTEDLDRVYEALSAITTDGGDEFVGGVLARALDDLEWSRDDGALRVVYVAGNESADQDRERPFREVCDAARGRGVLVNAIYCGPDGVEGDPAGWREVAQRGGGAYVAIDMNGTVQVDAPQDPELVRLGAALNGTYLPFGADGARGCANQTAQDRNAEAASASTGAQRAAAKATGLYSNGSWDLVDARRAEGFDWAKLAEADLPEALRGKTPAERDAVLGELAARRQALQAQIQALAAARQRFVEAELARRAGDAGRSIDAGLLGALRAQAQARGFSFE